MLLRTIINKTAAYQGLMILYTLYCILTFTARNFAKLSSNLFAPNDTLQFHPIIITTSAIVTI
jgi:hypothetical protein